MILRAFLVVLLLFSAGQFIPSAVPDWGFFAHRRINRLAVFTLPPELIVFYKAHLEYVTEHAVDPDKRRYATKYEAPRHFIDLDRWGEYPFPDLPRDWVSALMKNTRLYVVGDGSDTLEWIGPADFALQEGRLVFSGSRQGGGLAGGMGIHQYRSFFIRQVMPGDSEDRRPVDCDSLQAVSGYEIPCRAAFAVDSFSAYGVLPYHLLRMQRQLTEAFRQRSAARILRLSAEMGHYIADAHVPLHTTENYNGQLSGQEGIHAFWESRIPELFADETYDFFVGKAAYIDRPEAYYWEVVLASHRLVGDVLGIEKALSREFPSDRQYCFEERLGVTVRTQCREYAAAFQERLGGQVERRMRDAVLAVGSSWYTAWVDAGQPDLSELAGAGIPADVLREMQELEMEFRRGEIKGRSH